MAAILCFATPTAASASGGVAGYDQIMQQASQLLSLYKDSEALQLYEKVLSEAPENYEALCRSSFLHCRIGERYSDESSKIDHFVKAKQYAQQAYALNPQDAESNFVMALATGCEAMVVGPRQRLIDINEMKGFVDAALGYDAQHAGAWHLLGRWYFKMANLNLAEKVASKMLFGGVCGEATNLKAAEALEHAITYSPNNIRYYFELASVYTEMKDMEACKAVLEKAVTLQYETKEELEFSRRCRLMLQGQLKS